MFSRSKISHPYISQPILEINPHEGHDSASIRHIPPPSSHGELTPQELSEEISISLTTTNGGSSLSSSGASFIDPPFKSNPNQIGYRPARMTEPITPLIMSKVKPVWIQTANKHAARKRDSFLPGKSKPIFERPLFISAPIPKWDAPPFFKALSDAVKHAQLASCSIPADSIIHISSHDKSGKLVEDMGIGSDHQKTEKARAKHQRQVSESLAKAEWSHKIYVLISSGHLLQYSSDGMINRLPEKMVQLRKDSVAFASDVIPGRHWVLQISNVIDPLAPPPVANAEARKARSRLSFRPIEENKSIMNMLLVLDNGEELDSWLTAVRHEIEVLGGKPCESETGSMATANDKDDASLRLRSGPGSLAHNQIDGHSPALTSQEPLYETQSTQPSESDRESWALEERQQSEPRPSVDAVSQATSSNSHEDRLLDSLRNSVLYSHSRISSGARTHVTSPSAGSSPLQSPMKMTFFNDADDTEEDETIRVVEFVQQRPNAAAINERRRSLQTQQPPILEVTLPSRPISSAGFSQSSAAPAPGIAATDAVMRPRSARKNPPAALMTRLSVVEDQPSPALLDHIPTLEVETPSSPAEQSPKLLDGEQEPHIPIPPRSRRRPSLTTPINTKQLCIPNSAHTVIMHENGLTPIPSPSTSEDEFQFRYWNSRLQNTVPPTASEQSAAHSHRSLYRSDPFDLERALAAVDSPLPPPIPMDSYPFSKEESHIDHAPEPKLDDEPQPETSEPIDPAMIPLPLSPILPPILLSTPTARANARALSIRAERAAAGQCRDKRDSIGKPSRRTSRAPSHHRPTPPAPLSSRCFLNLGTASPTVLTTLTRSASNPTRPSPTRSTHAPSQFRASSIARPPGAAPPVPRRTSIVVTPPRATVSQHPAAAADTPAERRRRRSSRLSARRSVPVTDAGPPLAPPPTCGLPPVPVPVPVVGMGTESRGSDESVRAV